MFFDHDIHDDDEWEAYFTHQNRQARRKRKPQAAHKAKKAKEQLWAELADETEILEGNFKTTYKPSIFEQGWLLQSLQPFFDQNLITDILSTVKGGKEANVYCCRASSAHGNGLMAAKVYRPRQFRTLRNDRVYRDGREMLTAEGKAMGKLDVRMMRAVQKGSHFGFQSLRSSWIMYEYQTLRTLHQQGAAVPQPIGAGESAILMDFIGEGGRGAPLLSEIALEREEAMSLFNEVLHNIKLMLGLGMVHGDLSPYNILYWEGKLTLIDFPQVIYSHTNPQAYAILGRDIQRICEYFARFGVRSYPEKLTESLWMRYVSISPEDRSVALSGMLPEVDDE